MKATQWCGEDEELAVVACQGPDLMPYLMLWWWWSCCSLC